MLAGAVTAPRLITLSSEQAQSSRDLPALSDATSFALDLLRGLTAEAVVIGHALSFFRVLPGAQPPHVPAMQEVGVVIFFVLSGFLIAHTTWTRKSNAAATNYGFRHFFIDRFSRIYAGYVPALLFILLVDSISLLIAPGAYVHGGALDAKTALGNLLMLENFPALDILHRRVASVPAIDRLGSGRPLWTLAVEWWIYMFFGWLVLARRRNRPWAYWSVLALLSIVPAWNLVWGLGDGIALAWVYGAGACALIWRGTAAVFSRRAWTAAACLCTAVTVTAGAYANGRAYDRVLVALIAATVTIGILGLQQSRLVVPATSRRWVRRVADYSFTLYLVHYTVLEATTLARGRVSDPALVVIGVVASNLLAVLLAALGEMRHRTLSTYLHRRFS
ncbi:MAG: acyltransferase [Labilithrix sp.]|nr:acyltransferase [Labilithrix sp.]